MVNKLVHTVVPDDASHGKRFRAIALKVGLSGKIHKAEPGPLLQKRLEEIADTLGKLPHASLNIEDNPMTTRPLDRPKRRSGSKLKAECLECANEGKSYILRIAAASVRDVGKPHCPKHSEMSVEEPAEEHQDGTRNDDAGRADAAE